MDRFGYLFFITHFATNKQHHTTAQNTSNQLAQCNFHHVCSCMISVLFSNMLKETRAVYYVGQSFPEVGWYGKTCLYSLWILLMKSAVRIWIGLDGCFPSLTSQPTPAAPHNRTKYQQPTCAMQFSPCVFLHGFCSVFHYAERDTCSRLCLEVWYSTVPESKCCLQQLNQPNVIISHSCNTCGHFLQLEYR